eukprot:5556592-Ditylum_brightwellii.AAC.1
MIVLLLLNRLAQGDTFDQEQRDTVKVDAYDWTDDKEHQMLHSNDDGSDFDTNIEKVDDAAAAAHASIGREVLIVTIQAFHDTLFSRIA